MGYVGFFKKAVSAKLLRAVNGIASDFFPKQRFLNCEYRLIKNL